MVLEPDLSASRVHHITFRLTILISSVSSVSLLAAAR